MPLLLAVPLSAACQGEEDAPLPHQELRDSLGLGPSVVVHRVTLGGWGGEEHVVPGRLRVEEGDIVQFVSVDGRIHTVFFEADSLGPAQVDFLRSSGQLSGPPLLDRGSRFVVSFGGAPAGVYPFRVEGPGGPVRGRVVVESGGPPS